MKIYYRICEPKSDGDDCKKKLRKATKEKCLLNTLKCFPNAKLTIFADNVSDKTYNWLCSLCGDVKRINCGTEAKSFIEIIKIALQENIDDQVLYLLEDDYIHIFKDDIEDIILDGLKHSNYLTLYTHPDKWQASYNGGNPYVENDDVSEKTRVILTKSHYWCYTNSTTCSFICRVKDLKDDFDIWNEATQGIGTHDFEAFLKIGNKGKKIAMPLPSIATHTLIHTPSVIAPLTGLNIKNWEDILDG